MNFLFICFIFLGKIAEGFNLLNNMRLLGLEKMNAQHNYFVVVGLRSRLGGGPFLVTPFSRRGKGSTQSNHILRICGGRAAYAIN